MVDFLQHLQCSAQWLFCMKVKLMLTWNVRFNKRVQNLAVSKEPWDISEVIRDKHGINKNIPGLGRQKKYSSRATSAAEKVCLSRMTPNWRMCKWNTELAYSTTHFSPFVVYSYWYFGLFGTQISSKLYSVWGEKNIGGSHFPTHQSYCLH